MASKVKLNSAQRQHLAETFREVGNLIIAAISVGFLIEKSVSLALTLAVLGFYAIMIILTTWLRKER